MNLTIKTLAGLEHVLAAELTELGLENVEAGARVVTGTGDRAVLYRINYESRLALRVLVQIAQFKTKHENHFYKKVSELDWMAQFRLDQTFAIDAVTQSKYLRHSRYLALKCKDAIVDQFRARNNEQRPSVDVRQPDLRLNVHLGNDNVCTIARDASGSSLHRRGYRSDSVEAPLNEVLAAGMLALAGYTGERPFLDPMCGSGTLPIEAAIIASRTAPQKGRRDRFGFESWDDFDADLWERTKRDAHERERPAPQPIHGSDRDFAAYRAAQRNAAGAGVGQYVELRRAKFEKVQPPTETPGLLVMNPLYDERLKSDEILEEYKQYGDLLKQNFPGWTAWIISGNQAALRRIGLGAAEKVQLKNGGIDCSYRRFDLYEGSRREG